MPGRSGSQDGKEEDDGLSRRTLQIVIDTVPQRVFWKDRNSVYLGCNSAFARDAGADSPTDLLGKTDLELPWKEQAHLYRADDKQVMDSGEARMDIVEPITYADGRAAWLRTCKVPLRDSNGRVFGVLGTYEDITAQRQATAAHAASEERFRATFESAAIGIAELAPDGRFLRVNEKLCSITGYEDAELLARTFADVTHSDDLRQSVEQFEQLVAGEVRGLSSEQRLVRADGRRIWVQVSVAPVRDPEGRLKYNIAVVEDIEARKRIEEDRARFAEMIRQAAESIIMTDTTGRIMYVNPAFEELTGHAVAEVIGRNPRILKSGRHDDALYRELWETIEDGRAWTGHLVNRRKDGSLFEVEATIFPLRDEANHVIGYVGIHRDVTSEVKLRLQLQQAQRMEAVGRLAGGVAHDFNNLLTVIMSYGELAMENLPDHSPVRAMVAEMLSAGGRAAQVTRQLLAFSRKQVVQPKVFDLNELLSSLDKLLTRLIREDIRLVTILAERPCLVRADPGQIEQVVMNLVVNARDAMPGGGRLTVETREAVVSEPAGDSKMEPGTYVVLTVSDTGTGMDAETRAHAFDPFYTTKETGKGTGLGLAMVYGAVQQAGGTISIDTEPGMGTTFTIYLPCAPVPAEVSHRARSPAAAGGGRRERILLVEDDAQLRELMRVALSAFGYYVVVAREGREALDVVSASLERIDLLVTDVVMPVLGGRGLADALAVRHPEIKVLFVSGYVDDAELPHGILEPGMNFLPKPFTPDALRAKVREALDREEGADHQA